METRRKGSRGNTSEGVRLDFVDICRQSAIEPRTAMPRKPKNRNPEGSITSSPAAITEEKSSAPILIIFGDQTNGGGQDAWSKEC